jgi:hypothetical protein
MRLAAQSKKGLRRTPTAFSYRRYVLQRTLPAGFIAPCLPTKTDRLPSGGEWSNRLIEDVPNSRYGLAVSLRLIRKHARNFSYSRRHDLAKALMAAYVRSS